MALVLHRAVVWVALLTATSLGAQERLSTIAEVHALSPAEAARELPVQLEATVTFADLPNGGVFIHDLHEGIYLEVPRELRPESPFRAGDRIRTEATTNPGQYIPALVARSFEFLGSGAMPTPTLVSEKNLFSPGLDCQWVSLSGVIVSVEPGPNRQVSFVVEVYGWTLKVLMPADPDLSERLPLLMQQRVRFQGVAATVYNQQRQMTGRYFLVPSLDYVKLLNEGQGKDATVVLSVDHLLRSDTSTENIVRVRGVVTHAANNELYLRGEGGSLRVMAANSSQLKVGDSVEAEGFATIAPFRPVLRARRVVKLGAEPLPEPKPLELSPGSFSSFAAELVLIEADYLGRRDSPDAIVLQCRSEDQFFESLLPARAAVPDDLIPGCRLRLVGNCELTTSHPLPRSEWVDGFRLHLRGPEDLQIIRRPSWWTAERLLTALAIAAGLGLVAATWIWSLRRRVVAQTKIISTQIEREAVLSERHRIARELHDTLEQELTGVAIQLRNVHQGFDKTPDKAREALKLAQQMLRYSRDEARTSIRDLRSVLLEQRGLAGALEETLPPLVAEAATQFDFATEGRSRRLDASAENHLLRIAQEAVANAAHHAEASIIQVRLAYEIGMVTLTVRDNGRGFDPIKGPPRGHFGLLGMQERANKLQATLQIESGRAAGTTIRLVVPTQPEDPCDRTQKSLHEEKDTSADR